MVNICFLFTFNFKCPCNCLHGHIFLHIYNLKSVNIINVNWMINLCSFNNSTHNNNTRQLRILIHYMIIHITDSNICMQSDMIDNFRDHGGEIKCSECMEVLEIYFINKMSSPRIKSTTLLIKLYHEKEATQLNSRWSSNMVKIHVWVHWIVQRDSFSSYILF